MLGGDAVAAEYLLLHCISHVYYRVADICVGRFCLNLHVGFTGPDEPEEAAARSSAIAQELYRSACCFSTTRELFRHTTRVG